MRRGINFNDRVTMMAARATTTWDALLIKETNRITSGFGMTEFLGTLLPPDFMSARNALLEYVNPNFRLGSPNFRLRSAQVLYFLVDAPDKQYHNLRFGTVLSEWWPDVNLSKMPRHLVLSDYDGSPHYELLDELFSTADRLLRMKKDTNPVFSAISDCTTLPQLMRVYPGLRHFVSDEFIKSVMEQAMFRRMRLPTRVAGIMGTADFAAGLKAANNLTTLSQLVLGGVYPNIKVEDSYNKWNRFKFV